MAKVLMGEYYDLTNLGLVRTIGRAKNCETQKQMVMFTVVQQGGFAGENLLLNEDDFLDRIDPTV